ncbi:hypothetical protein [Amycolatopsis coloradensis]|nr:hypothetical protein [Amycolatopsis coloradensis]
MLSQRSPAHFDPGTYAVHGLPLLSTGAEKNDHLLVSGTIIVEAAA